ncbi:hypothetical protein X740_08795 [Mesorhizobium sp. LNHC221B00]|nr:hypothetical protein X740_08795 [Mesorhizobium sp. LNHC221B00]
MSVLAPASRIMELASMPAENRDLIRLRHRALACRSMIEASIMPHPRLLSSG